jgi:hypothetical protein
MTLKEQFFEKNQTGGLYNGPGRTAYKFFFSVIFLKNLLSAYTENTLNGEKSNKI